jgi:carotenoid cleavage dioxygenase-like enzyme
MPEWLDGALLRNGPARFEAGEKSVNHWFDGLAMLHRFGIREGRVSYSNRFLRTKAFEASNEGRIGYREFASDPCRTMFNRIASLFVESEMSDNAFISIAEIDERFVAMSETPLGVVFDPDTLETLGHDRHPPGHLPTAHPQFDPVTGEMINFAVHLGPVSSYRLYIRNGADRTIGSLRDMQPAYLHSFGLTERFVILVLGPLRVQPMSLAMSSKPFIENYRWNSGKDTEFVAFDRRTGKVAQRWSGEPIFLFHHINAFEEGDDLVVDLCAYRDARLIDDLYLGKLRAGGGVDQPRPRRYRLPLGGGEAGYEVLADAELELPRINDRFNTKPYGVAWGISRTQDEAFGDALARLDVKERSVCQWSEPGCHPGEPIFVSRPGAIAEDDGILLSVVLDAAAGRSFLLVLDAAEMEELARAEVPHHIPFGIHGHFRQGSGQFPRN